ncbi:MAG: hypothetical protein U0R71_16700 [Solirubrobacterales bacterium]
MAAASWWALARLRLRRARLGRRADDVAAADLPAGSRLELVEVRPADQLAVAVQAPAGERQGERLGVGRRLRASSSAA